MLTPVGFFVVAFCVFGGFAIHGGDLRVLNQPNEFLIIFGAALGSVLISSPQWLIKMVLKQMGGAFKEGTIAKEKYVELLLLLFELIKTAKGNLLGLEAHVEKPENSDIFKRYPGVLKNHHAIDFICDTLKVQISSPVSPFDLEELMETDMNSAHTQELKAPALVATVGDALPGLGIVAAVLGVVYTMGKLSEGKEVIGHSVAAALVGTFVGIFASYGFVGPLAKKMEENLAEEGQYMAAIKVALLAFAKDASPKVCVEFARRSIPPEVRPTFEEVDTATANAGKKAA